MILRLVIAAPNSAMRFIVLVVFTLLPGMPGRGRDAAQSTFLGFDRNEYPSDANLPLLRKTFSYSGYWLNAPPGEQRSSWTGKRQILLDAGFGFLVLFTGRQYAEIRGHSPALMGADDGRNAAAAAKQQGFPPMTIIFLDQEEGGRLLPEQRDYLLAWIDAVSAARFRAGVYCSGMPFAEPDGTVITTANDIRDHAEGRRIAFWVSNDQCRPSPGCGFPHLPPAPKMSGVPYADVWQFAQSPRRKAFTANCAATYSRDGNCYPPDFAASSQLHVDVNTATSPDPSQGR